MQAVYSTFHSPSFCTHLMFLIFKALFQGSPFCIYVAPCTAGSWARSEAIASCNDVSNNNNYSYNTWWEMCSHVPFLKKKKNTEPFYPQSVYDSICENLSQRR